MKPVRVFYCYKHRTDGIWCGFDFRPVLSENGLLLLLGTAAILASEFRQGFAERSGLASVFSAERSHMGYCWYELVLLSMWGRG